MITGVSVRTRNPRRGRPSFEKRTAIIVYPPGDPDANLIRALTYKRLHQILAATSLTAAGQFSGRLS